MQADSLKNKIDLHKMQTDSFKNWLIQSANRTRCRLVQGLCLHYLKEFLSQKTATQKYIIILIKEMLNSVKCNIEQEDAVWWFFLLIVISGTLHACYIRSSFIVISYWIQFSYLTLFVVMQLLLNSSFSCIWQ